MTGRIAALALAWASAICGQTQVDLSRQARGILGYTSGGTNATSQVTARTSVGTPKLIATDFAGADLGAKVNAAFASFTAGTCGTVMIPSGTFSYSSAIFVPTGCILEGTGRGGGAPENNAGTGTQLIYNGPPATSAVVLMNPDMSRSDYTTVRDLTIISNANVCPNNGMLAWNPAAGGSNKWQCYDGTSHTAPIPHLAGIQHGNTDPTLLTDGTHNRVVNVDIRGTTDINTKGQGGFHFGVYLNGCEECLLESVYAGTADDGFKAGPSTNGVLLNQVTARSNRRSGFHYNGQNHFLCSECLFEGNQWYGHPGADVTKYGAGIRVGDDANENATGGKFIKPYFEANDIDIYGAAGASGIETENGNQGQSFGDRGSWLNATLATTTVPTFDTSHDAASGIVNYTGAISGPPAKAAGAPTYLAIEQKYGFPSRVFQALNDGTIQPTYELSFDPTVASGMSYLTLRGNTTSGTGLNLERAYPTAAAGDSPNVTFKGTNGAGNDFVWKFGATARKPGGSDTGTNLLYVTNNDAGTRNFAYYPNSIFKILNTNTTDTPRLEIGVRETNSYTSNANMPALWFSYRSDDFSTGPEIASFNSITPNSRLFIKSDAIDFQTSGANYFTARFRAGSSQSTQDIAEFYDSGSNLTSYVSPTGGIAIRPTGAQPACDSTKRFLLWTMAGAAGVKDSVQICAKDASDVYSWRTIY